jgi:2-succinyl-5-enolpyruvyl-6-hydroxy-3-cyclohexene-1-carboxylate synthase
VARRARGILESGPAHLNLQFAEPLGWAPGPWPERSGHEPGTGGGSPGSPARPGLPALPGHERGVVVAGDGAGAFAWMLARVRGWPLLAEPTSLARVEAVAVPRYQALLSSDEGAALAARAEVVVTVGRPTLSRQVRALVEGAPELWAVLPGPLGRAPLNARRVIPAPDDGWWREVDPVLVPAAPSPWSEAWRTAAAALPPDPASGEWGVEGVAAEVCRLLPAGVPLVAGSSRAVRALDAVMPAAPAEAVRRVVANRGLAGIDGTVSTAVGVALGCGGGWALALMGDLTFLHDAGGLLIGPHERRPDLRIVVLNDGGGTIFSGLEHAGADRAAFSRVFTTPHGADIGALCAGYGVAHTPVRSVAELSDALAGRPTGVQVVEALLA